MKRTQSRVRQAVSQRLHLTDEVNKVGAADAMETGEEAFPVSVSLRPSREREAETVMVSA